MYLYIVCQLWILWPHWFFNQPPWLIQNCLFSDKLKALKLYNKVYLLKNNVHMYKKKYVFNEILMISSKFKNDFYKVHTLDFFCGCWCGKNFSGIIIFNTLLPLFSKEQSRECISIEKWNWATSKCGKKCWKLHCLVARFFLCVLCSI